MSDLIDRQMLINLLTSRAETLRGLYGDLGGAASGVRKLVQTLPSVKPQRKMGKWIDGTLYQDFDECEWEKVKCSVCKNFVTKQIFYHDNKYHYCPYCGADMRGENE